MLLNNFLPEKRTEKIAWDILNFWNRNPAWTSFTVTASFHSKNVWWNITCATTTAKKNEPYFGPLFKVNGAITDFRLPSIEKWREKWTKFGCLILKVTSIYDFSGRIDLNNLQAKQRYSAFLANSLPIRFIECVMRYKIVVYVLVIHVTFLYNTDVHGNLSFYSGIHVYVVIREKKKSYM